MALGTRGSLLAFGARARALFSQTFGAWSWTEKARRRWPCCSAGAGHVECLEPGTGQWQKGGGAGREAALEGRRWKGGGAGGDGAGREAAPEGRRRWEGGGAGREAALEGSGMEAAPAGRATEAAGTARGAGSRSRRAACRPSVPLGTERTTGGPLLGFDPRRAMPGGPGAAVACRRVTRGKAALLPGRRGPRRWGAPWPPMLGAPGASAASSSLPAAARPREGRPPDACGPGAGRRPRRDAARPWTGGLSVGGAGS